MVTLEIVKGYNSIMYAEHKTVINFIVLAT